MKSFPVLITKRLVLREFQASDAVAVFDIFSQDIATRYHNLETMLSVERAKKVVAARSSLFENGIGIRWGIALKDRPDIIIGSCGYYHLNRAFRSAEMGYDLHPAFWRQGFMTEALTAAIDHGFSDRYFFRLNRVEALTYLQHEASVGLLKKLGFQEEGIRREYGYWKGQFHDLRSFSLLRRDWVT
jgi:ribosomal-protein-alanine N-acetyltransferase